LAYAPPAPMKSIYLFLSIGRFGLIIALVCSHSSCVVGDLCSIKLGIALYVYVVTVGTHQSPSSHHQSVANHCPAMLPSGRFVLTVFHHNTILTTSQLSVDIRGFGSGTIDL